MIQTPSTSEKVECIEVEINFECVPTIKQAIEQSMFADRDYMSWVVWFPALWTSGRYAHVYFAHAGVPYHVSNLKTSDLRHQYNTEQRFTHTYRIWVTRENLAKAMLMSEKANTKSVVGHLWCNCTHTISVLLYGHDRKYGLFGTRFGWFTRRVLRDVEMLQAAQR